ncbi:MAG: hypothetical protein LBJ67_05255 [Planctomycetaceae bacterium]|nr:hypothetical protein [Planctomycetaceae bacterium]
MKLTTLGFGLIVLGTFLLSITGVCEFKYFEYYRRDTVPLIDRCMFYLAWFHMIVGYMMLLKAWLNNEEK